MFAPLPLIFQTCLKTTVIETLFDKDDIVISVGYLL